MKLSTAVAFFTLFGMSLAMPVDRSAYPGASHTSPTASTPAPTTTVPATTEKKVPGIAGMTTFGAGFEASGDNTAGAAADKHSGVAAGSIDGLGTVLGLAGPGLATAAALSTPSL